MIEQLFEFFSGAGKHWALFFVSVFPFIELRGAIPFGILALDMPWYQAFLLSFAANLLPIPVVYFLTRPLFAALRKTKLFSGFIDRFEAKMMKKSEKVTKYKIIGLFLFVAVPLPSTGAWTGALIAALSKATKVIVKSPHEAIGIPTICPSKKPLFRSPAACLSPVSSLHSYRSAA